MSKEFSGREQKDERFLPDYLEEAKRIEAELDSMEDPWADDQEIGEKMRLKIYQGILAEQERRQKQNSFIHRAVKYAAMTAITVVAIFSVSMTSQANRERLIRSISYLIGNREIIEVSNTENLEDDGMEEEKIRAEIEDKLDCDPPVFMYRPKGFSFRECSIYENRGIALIQYDYNGESIFIYMSKNDNEFIDTLSHQGAVIDRFQIETEQVTINGTERKDKGDKQSAYVGYWIYNNCYYDINGKIEKKEFKKILENIYF